MSRRNLLFLAAVLTLIGVSTFVKNSRKPQSATPPAAPAASSPQMRDPITSPRRPSTHPSPLPSPDTPPPNPNLSQADRSRIDEEISDAVTTYDPEGLPTLERYLDHPDPEIRQRAASGLQRMGLAEGAPILRAAAEKRITTHPKEAAEFLKIAAFLELPSAREAIRKRFQEKGSVPTPPKPPLPPLPSPPAPPPTQER